MKIWLDVTSLFHSSTEHSECGGEECRECGDYDKIIPYTSLICNKIIEHTQTCPFLQTETLYLQAYKDGRWLICDTIGTGQIAILDQQAMTLLTQFRTPTTLLDVLQRVPSWSRINIENAMTMFYRLGFLQDAFHARPSPEYDHSHTLSAWLHVTNACNLRCHYCYLSKSLENMTDITAQRAVDAIFRSATKHHYQHIQLKYAGGEASLHLASTLAIHDYAVKLARQHTLKLHAYIMSNGVALSQRVIDQLKARRIDIMISLDGLGNHHDRQRPFINGQGSFKYVDNTITRILASGFKPYISVTISQRNLDGLPNLMGYLLEHELPFTLNYYRDNEFSSNLHDLQFTEKQMIAAMQDVFSMIEQRLPRYRLIGSLIDKANLNVSHLHTCGVGRNYLVIDQHGGIAKCHADIHHRISTIDAEDPLETIRSNLDGVRSFSVEDKEGCRTCMWRYWCTGGCPLLTYRVTGRSDVKSPNCNIYKALFPEALHLEALRLLKYISPISLL